MTDSPSSRAPGRPERPLRPDLSNSSRDLFLQMRQYRERTGRTYREIAERMATSRSSVSRVLSGEQLPSRAFMEQFADAAGLSVDERNALLAARAEAVRDNAATLDAEPTRDDSSAPAPSSLALPLVTQAIASLSHVETAVLMIGNVLIVKNDGQLVAQEVSESVRNRLMHSPELNEPAAALKLVIEEGDRAKRREFSGVSSVPLKNAVASRGSLPSGAGRLFARYGSSLVRTGPAFDGGALANRSVSKFASADPDGFVGAVFSSIDEDDDGSGALGACEVITHVYRIQSDTPEWYSLVDRALTYLRSLGIPWDRLKDYQRERWLMSGKDSYDW